MKFNYLSLFKKEYLLLFFLILVGSYLRLTGVFTNSFAFTYDVGRDLLAVRDIVVLHKISLIGPTSGLPGVFYGPWWYLVLVPFFILFGGNPQGIAFSISFLGIVLIILAYILGKKIDGKLLGFSFATITAVSSGTILTQIWSPDLAPFFVFLSLLALYKIYKEKSVSLKYPFLLGLFLGLTQEMGIVFGSIFLLGIILSIIINVYKKISLKSTISFLLGFLFILLPRILFEFRHQFLMTKAFISFVMGGDLPQKTGVGGMFIDRLNILFNSFNSALALENKIFGIILIFLISVTLILTYKKTDVLVKKFISTSLIVLLVFLVALTFSSMISGHII